MKLPFLFLPLILLTAVAAQAATLNVTTTADAGAGSLRAQIAAAAGGDTVAISVSGTITLTSGEIAFTGKNLVIAGPGASTLTITTGGTSRALHLFNSQSTLTGLTFANCKGLPGDVDTGGAITVDNFSSGGGANLTTISDCAFTNNQSGWGGAVDIFNGGLAMSRCTFSGNTCTGVAFGTNGGGGALSLGPTLVSTITNCTFSGNSQTGSATGQPGGGAIYNYGSGTASPPVVVFEHCTFVGNVDAAGAAGAVRGNYTNSYRTWANLRNCLLVSNQAPTTVLRNFAGNPSGLLTASYASLGGNVTDEAVTSSQFMASNGGDKVNIANLASSVSPTLALSGGGVPTHAISRGSPAQRTGAPSLVNSDERGAPRHSIADAGAFELIEPEIRVTVGPAPINEGGSLDFGQTPFGAPATRTLTITNTQTSVFTTGPLSVAGASATTGFAISGFPATSLANGQSATFSVTLSSVDTGLFSGSLTFNGNDAYNPALVTTGANSPNRHVVNLGGLVTDTMDHWRQQYLGVGSTNSGLAADSANPAGDGISNLLKYALGLNPQQAYPPATSTPTSLDASGHLSMMVARNPAAVDINLAIEVTGGLGLPSAWSTSDTTIDQNTFTMLQAHDNFSRATAPVRFIRLKVTRP